MDERVPSPIPALVGLSEEDATRTAAEVLARVVWEAPAFDPNRMSARDFLDALDG